MAKPLEAFAGPDISRAAVEWLAIERYTHNGLARDRERLIKHPTSVDDVR